MARACGIVTMITDFGLRDGYAGVMKGVILSINSQARVVDISHLISPGDVLHAALMMSHVCQAFPPGSVHLAVVDPGVGGERKALAVETERYFFVGPDNGVLSPALRQHPPVRLSAIENPRYLLPARSDTFHGRDVFAPVAAHCSAGVPVERFGPGLDAYRMLELSRPRGMSGELHGQVVVADRFGNIITDVSRADLEAFAGDLPVMIHLKDRDVVGICRSYEAVSPGRLLAIFNSWDHLEIAVSGGDAASFLGARRGDPVVIRRHDDR